MARLKGSKNKTTIGFAILGQPEDIALKYDLQPFEFLMAVVNNDWKRLGFDAASKVSYTNAGIEFEEANIKLTDRVSAAKEAAKYVYSAKQAVAISTPDGSGIKIVVEDYTTKKPGKP